MQRLKSQNARFYGLISKLKLDKDEKKALVLEASAGRCTSSKDLSAHEMQRVIEMLSGTFDSRIARMQAKARAISQDIGILKTVGGKIDYTAMNAFVMRTCKVENMFKLNHNQLCILITALEKWRDSKTKRMIKESLNGV